MKTNRTWSLPPRSSESSRRLQDSHQGKPVRGIKGFMVISQGRRMVTGIPDIGNGKDKAQKRETV